MKFGGRSYPFPTYEETFRTLRTHLLMSEPLSCGEAPSQKRKALEKDNALVHSALALGHCYMAYDNYADSTGFTFEAKPSAGDGAAPAALMGDAPTFAPEAVPGAPAFVLTAQTPRTRSLVRLYKDGRLVAAARGGRLDFPVRMPGVYRIEVYLYRRRIGSLCFGAKPWIFSNPIYIQPAPVPSSAALPAQKTDASAQVN